MKSINKRSKDWITEPSDDKVIISSEYYENDRPSYICSICNQTLSRLSDAGRNNSTYWCRNCSIEYDPESENLRKESKIYICARQERRDISSANSWTRLPKQKGIDQPYTRNQRWVKGIATTWYEDNAL